jgi:hypothetical protein
VVPTAGPHLSAREEEEKGKWIAGLHGLALWAAQMLVGPRARERKRKAGGLIS